MKSVGMLWKVASSMQIVMDGPWSNGFPHVWFLLTSFQFLIASVWLLWTEYHFKRACLHWFFDYLKLCQLPLPAKVAWTSILTRIYFLCIQSPNEDFCSLYSVVSAMPLAQLQWCQRWWKKDNQPLETIVLWVQRLCYLSLGSFAGAYY